ncbi:hypothetical protein GCM10027414_35310 [Humibacter ginsengiterrae]
MIRAVLFDLDGVVRHFYPEYVAAIELRHGLQAGSIEEFAFSHPVIDDVTTGRISRRQWIETIAVFFTDDSPAKRSGAAVRGMRTHHFTTTRALRQALRDNNVPVHQ